MQRVLRGCERWLGIGLRRPLLPHQGTGDFEEGVTLSRSRRDSTSTVEEVDLQRLP